MTRAEQRRLQALQAVQFQAPGTERALPPSLLLELHSEPVTFHRPFVDLGGGVTAALFLSVACDEAGKLPPHMDGWLRYTTEQWREMTCLSRTEQDSARKALRERGLIEERRAGMPARLEIKVNTAHLLDLLHRQASEKYAAFDAIDYTRID